MNSVLWMVDVLDGNRSAPPASGQSCSACRRGRFHRPQLRQDFFADQLDTVEPVVEAEAEVVGQVLEPGLVVLDGLFDDVVRIAGDQRAFEVVRAVPAAGLWGDP